MTEKELLYLEDAIGHEKSIIEIFNNLINNIEDSNLLNFMSLQMSNHEKIKENLISLLKEKANE